MLSKPRTERNVGAAVGDRSEKDRQFSRPVTVVAIEEHDDIGSIGEA
jgi:hypothetical protein